MQTRPIRTTFIVALGLTFVQLNVQTNTEGAASNENEHSDIRQNLHHFFDSIIKNDRKKTKTYGSILVGEAAKERQAFDTMKGELQSARQLNAIKQTRSGQNSIQFKREAPDDKNNLKYYTGMKFEHKFDYSIFVDEMPNGTKESPVINFRPWINNTDNFAEVHICDLETDELLRICREATKDEWLKTTKVTFIEGGLPGPKKPYQFTCGSYNLLGKPPIVVISCPCPTDPLMYLKDYSHNTIVEAFISIREAYSRLNDTRE